MLVYMRLDLEEVKATTIYSLLIDPSSITGVVDDVLIKVVKFIFLVDLFFIDIERDLVWVDLEGREWTKSSIYITSETILPQGCIRIDDGEMSVKKFEDPKGK